MPASRKTKPKADAPQQDPLAGALQSVVFVTTDHLSALGLSLDDGRVLVDASAVHGKVQANPWITQDALAKWAAGEWGDGAIDRLNAATGLLMTAGRVARIGA